MLLVTSCLGRACPMQAEVGLYPPPHPASRHGQHPPSAVARSWCPGGGGNVQKSTEERLYSSKAESSALESKAAMVPWGWFASPLGTVHAVVLLGLFLVSQTRCAGATVSPQVPALSCCGGSAGAASGEAEAGRFRTLSG